MWKHKKKGACEHCIRVHPCATGWDENAVNREKVSTVERFPMYDDVPMLVQQNAMI